jgi:hypothetical protein
MKNFKVTIKEFDDYGNSTIRSFIIKTELSIYDWFNKTFGDGDVDLVGYLELN